MPIGLPVFDGDTFDIERFMVDYPELSAEDIPKRKPAEGGFGTAEDDNDETNDALTYDGDDVDDGSECAIELSLKQIEHFVKALNLHSYPLYPTKMWSKQ